MERPPRRSPRPLNQPWPPRSFPRVDARAGALASPSGLCARSAGEPVELKLQEHRGTAKEGAPRRCAGPTGCPAHRRREQSLLKTATPFRPKALSSRGRRGPGATVEPLTLRVEAPGFLPRKASGARRRFWTVRPRKMVRRPRAGPWEPGNAIEPFPPRGSGRFAEPPRPLSSGAIPPGRRRPAREPGHRATPGARVAPRTRPATRPPRR